MIHSKSDDYTGFSHASYIENDPVQYNVYADELVMIKSQETHFHDDVELLFIIEGDAILHVNKESNCISEGDLIMLMPYHVHSITLTGKTLKVYQCKVSLGLLLFSSISRTIEKHISYSLAYGNVVTKFVGKEQDSIHKNFEELIDELHTDNVLNTMIGLNIVTKIILLFSRSISAKILNSDPPEHGISWNLMRYINNNYSSEISARSLALEFSISPLKVNNHFYLLTGENLTENLHRTRIRFACIMLQFDQLSVNYISKYVGYKNLSTFFRKFKSVKNMTPAEYRKNHIPADNIYRNLNNAWKVTLYIYEHFTETLTELSISQALFLSPEAINNELLANFEVTLSELITQIRLQYACTYLQVLDTPIVKIAYLSGFSSVRTFNRCFKDVMNCTPQEFRKMME